MYGCDGKVTISFSHIIPEFYVHTVVGFVLFISSSIIFKNNSLFIVIALFRLWNNRVSCMCWWYWSATRMFNSIWALLAHSFPYSTIYIFSVLAARWARINKFQFSSLAMIIMHTMRTHILAYFNLFNGKYRETISLVRWCIHNNILWFPFTFYRILTNLHTITVHSKVFFCLCLQMISLFLCQNQDHSFINS